MKKKSFCSVLALILVLTLLAGCGQEEKTPQEEPSKASAEPTQAPAAPSEQKDTPAPEAAGDNPCLLYTSRCV